MTNPKIICHADYNSEELKIKVMQLGIGNLRCCEFVAQELYNNLDSCMIQTKIDDRNRFSFLGRKTV